MCVDTCLKQYLFPPWLTSPMSAVTMRYLLSHISIRKKKIPRNSQMALNTNNVCRIPAKNKPWVMSIMYSAIPPFPILHRHWGCQINFRATEFTIGGSDPRWNENRSANYNPLNTNSTRLSFNIQAIFSSKY